MLRNLLLICFISTSSLQFLSAATNCQKETDFEYVYTECQSNARWRVQVPRTDCTGESVEFPKAGLKCDAQCNSGEYLNVTQNSCVKCPAGTYSLGSGVRFDMWSALPAGFTLSADKVDPTSLDSSCSVNQWRFTGDYVAGQPGPDCQLSLTYTADLVVNGEVTFNYQYRSDSAFFAFEVQNGRCESVGREDSSSPLLEETDRNDIKQHTVQLKMGMNVLRWLILPLSERFRSSDSAGGSSGVGTGADLPIAIYSIEIRGIPYVYSCQACHPGFTSQPGSPRCAKCPRDQVSTGAGDPCRPCPVDKFAPAGSVRCSPRPLCRLVDYELAYPQQCSLARGYKIVPVFQWVQPRVCAAGVSLPRDDSAASQATSCRDAYCNPGMQVASSADPLTCRACPEGQFSVDNSGKCKPCPTNTQVVHEYVANNWMVTPPLMNLTCLVLNKDGSSDCGGPGWFLMGDRARTAATGLRHTLVMTLDLPGFHAPPDTAGSAPDTSDSGANAQDNDQVREVAALTIDFDMTCDTPCRLYLLKFEFHRHTEIKSWTGKQARKQFKYIIRRTNPHKFLLVFDPAPATDEDQKQQQSAPPDWIGNRLTVYSVRATNALTSGGVRCQACPLGIKDKKCIPCPTGKYFDAKNATCYPCPAGTVVARRPADDIGACAPCSPGMRPVGGVACEMDPALKLPAAASSKAVREFDFARLLAGDYWLASGAKQFTGRGSQYLHVYNVSLTSGSKARCVSNTSSAASAFVESFVCRATVVPNLRNASLTLSALPTSFGDRVLNVSSTERSPGAAAALHVSGWDPDPDGLDMHVFLETDYTTQVCPQRRITIVTLRCDPKAVRPRLSLPPKCPDGTCDGCNFNMMLESKQACPLCKLDDYERVKGECVLGKQTVHLYPPKRCYMPTGEPRKQTNVVYCPLVNKPVAIAMLVTIFIGLMSLAIAFHCYRKNRTLQYKYMQLVESKEGELPGVESCAVHEGEGDDDEEEEDEAEVAVRSGRRTGGGASAGGGGGAVLSKLRRSILPSGARGSRSGKEVEHLNLTEQMDDLSL